jgi:ABC-type Fe3+ transport system substrate-binding protein
MTHRHTIGVSMSSQISRRRALAGGAAALGAALGATYGGPAVAASAQDETRSLADLYRDALAEGGTLIIYAGGDRSAGADALRAAFQADFPRMKLTVIVDYSKFHDVRIDNQLSTGTLVPDVVQLQTLQDFTRWADQGRLLRYRPAGFDKVHSAFKDPAGAWIALQVVAFSYMHDPTLTDAPASPKELVDPRWKGRIASSYPNDDDAVLYLYKLYADAYGWDWMARLVAQDPAFARGSFTPAEAVTNKQKAIGIGGSGSLTAPPTAPVRWVAPAGHPFMAWGQRAAILKDADHPTAAKLYLNWQLSTARQSISTNGWSVRTDVTPAGGLAPIWTYPNANHDGFPRFMANRADAERWRQTFALYFGDVQGAPTPGRLGLHPGA